MRLVKYAVIIILITGMIGCGKNNKYKQKKEKQKNTSKIAPSVEKTTKLHEKNKNNPSSTTQVLNTERKRKNNIDTGTCVTDNETEVIDKKITEKEELEISESVPEEKTNEELISEVEALMDKIINKYDQEQKNHPKIGNKNERVYWRTVK